MVAMPQFDPKAFLEALGYVGVAGIVFLKSGLLIGFLLPGDTLLFTAGLLASQGFFNIWVLCVLCSAAAITGNSVGYAIGQFLGPRVFSRESSIWFNKKHLERAHAFYERHGGKTIVLARFMPIVRTFVPFVAGAAEMTYTSFAFFNVTGAVAWVAVCVGAGYVFGNVPIVKDNFTLVALGIVFVSLLPLIVELVKRRQRPSNPSSGEARA